MTSERGANTPETTGGDGSGQDLATLSARFVALFIDWVAILVLVNILNWFGYLTPDPFGQALAPGVLFIAYYVLALTFGNQSLGMGLMRIACVSATTGDRLGFLRALVRAVLLSLVLPALTALADPHHRGLHDRAAGSVMLKAPKASKP